VSPTLTITVGPAGMFSVTESPDAVWITTLEAPFSSTAISVILPASDAV